MKSDAGPTRDKIWTRVHLHEYSRAFTVIFPPMTYFGLAIRLASAIIIFFVLKDLFQGSEYVVKPIAVIYALYTLWHFFIVQAEYYALEKLNHAKSEHNPRDCCCHSLTISDLTKSYTMITPPGTWFDLILHILFACAGWGIVLYFNNQLPIPDEMFFALMGIVGLWLVIYLFNFCFPNADYYFMSVMKKV
jgi:hypothetical protein